MIINNMDNKEDKSEMSQLPIEAITKSEEEILAKEEVNNNDPPAKEVMESDANRGAEQVKEEENIPAEGKKNEQVIEKEIERSPELVYTLKINQIEKQSKCRPIAFLLGLPFALISLVIAFIGGIVWIIGLMLTCICPCCFCVTMLVEMALSLVNAPFAFFQYITDKIPF
ncbi:hypothetical protein HAX54_044163 [Datura stramonium]|uniref:Caveolin n=1 Tax=Datura stramonium TaxID=4076 RepID=A0ABS8RPJ7_DATST|nr:hypothetical protein [Datura stramonium]